MGRPTGPAEKPRLAKYYEQTVRPALMEKFQYTSVMQAPRLVKIVLNMGVGDALVDAKLLDAAANELCAIAGQRPTVRRAKKSISNFKLREGVPVGLRGDAARRAHVRVLRPPHQRGGARASATSAASTRGRSTAGATTRWA